MSRRKLYGKYDLLLFAVIIAAAVIIYIIINFQSRAGKTVCEITVDGKIVGTVDLSEPDREFELPQNPNIRFSIKNHAAAFTASDCPDKICVNTGYVSRAGQTAVCLPNRTAIRIRTDGGTDEMDIVIAK